MIRILLAMVLIIGMTVPNVGMNAGERSTSLVKLDFTDMTKTQEESLWRQVDKLAFFEATANLCGKSGNLENRIIAAVQECITVQALERVKNYWRNKVREEAKSFFSERSKRLEFCGKVDVARIHSRYLAEVDSKVQEAERLCSGCRISGLCR